MQRHHKTVIFILSRVQYSEGGEEPSTATADGETTTTAETSFCESPAPSPAATTTGAEEHFWRETESPPRRHSSPRSRESSTTPPPPPPSHAVLSLMPKLNLSASPAAPAFRVNQRASIRTSVPSSAPISTVYLPNRRAASAGRRSGSAVLLETCRRLAGKAGGQSSTVNGDGGRDVVRNTLSYQLDNSTDQV